MHETNNNTILLEKLTRLKYEAKMKRKLYDHYATDSVGMWENFFPIPTPDNDMKPRLYGDKILAQKIAKLSNL